MFSLSKLFSSCPCTETLCTESSSLLNVRHDCFHLLIKLLQYCWLLFIDIADKCEKENEHTNIFPFLWGTHGNLEPKNVLHDSIIWLSLMFPLCGCVKFTHINTPPAREGSHLTFSLWWI